MLEETSSTSAASACGRIGARAIHGLVDAGGVVADGHGLVASQPGFHQAALVVAARFAAILVIEMHLYSCEVVLDVAHGIVDRGFDVS